MTKANFTIELDTDGDVDLRKSGVTKLPENLAGGSLNLRGTGSPSYPTTSRSAVASSRRREPACSRPFAWRELFHCLPAGKLRPSFRIKEVLSFDI
jgi:hypothetical protein